MPDVRISTTKGESVEDDPAAAFEDPRSEFSGLVRLWRAYRKARQGPRRELRRWCKERQLSLLRLSEWDDVYAQVADRAAELRIVPQARAASYAAVHRSLLAGFCTNVGVRGEEGEYLGTRGVRFHIFPGSPLRRRKPTLGDGRLHRRDEPRLCAARCRGRALLDRGGRAAPVEARVSGARLG